MNCLLQQLYMLPSFREEILSVEDKNIEGASKEENMLYQIKVKEKIKKL